MDKSMNYESILWSGNTDYQAHKPKSEHSHKKKKLGKSLITSVHVPLLTNTGICSHRVGGTRKKQSPMAGTVVAGCYEQPSHIYTVLRQRFIDDTKLRVLFKWLLLLMRRKARQIEWFRWHSSANFCNEISKNDCSHFREAINRSKRDQRKEWHFLIMKNLIRSWLQIFFSIKAHEHGGKNLCSYSDDTIL